MGPLRESWQRSSHAVPALAVKRAECLDCHADRGIAGLAKAKVRGVRDALLWLSDACFPRSFRGGAHVYHTKCVSCHQGVTKVNHLESMDIPGLTEKRDLYFSHRRHLALREFDAREAGRLAELREQQPLLPTEKREIAWLEKVKRGNCGQCHLRQKRDEAGNAYVDLSVNPDQKDPMTCLACHQRNMVHGKTPFDTPGVQILACQRCHTGKLHGGLRPFLATKDPDRDSTVCVRCHPVFFSKSAATAAKDG